LSLSSIEDRLNWLSDQDWGWWPFLSLRPPRTQPIGLGRLLQIVLVFGTMGAAPMTLLACLIGPSLTFGVVWKGVVAFYLLVLLIYGGSFALAWNRRARRLAAPTADDGKRKG
jgi:hypothetical protein